MTDKARNFSAFFVCPPNSSAGGLTGYSEAASEALIWLVLRQLADVPEQGRALFAKPLSSQNVKWREFHNYARQARAYWDGARRIEGSSAALLYYYVFLNLAKAELLTTDAQAILGQRIHHGLSFNPTRAQTVNGDSLRVMRGGVFPLLYEKRTGIKLPHDTVLPVPRLLSMLHEIGMELAQTGMQSKAVLGYHAVVNDDEHAWPLICFLERGITKDRREPMARLLRTNFTEVEFTGLPSSWRDTFALSRRLFTANVSVYQSKTTFSYTDSTGTVGRDIGAAARFLRHALHPYVNDPVKEPADFVITPSLHKRTSLPMPQDLARYALMFYVSSLVRYKPSALDPVRAASAAWLLDSFTRETPIYLLSAALGGITRTPLAYETAGFRN